ncbi:bifunctional diguanylate cyclase/phosphodiesterase [Paenibacillus harenae]|uniref:Diguanylate cyclase (GGDEF)-like protein/PAS domain S-box-containing protein n=1 Tax=Paenibacillus harenae TaxID=306543 RepID=A0ABT9TUT5_PAEHA|nr:EAL domain-containing protein [Paenibacillus harenae]MDQ0111124.1 diguanylate cyclase (GGDEF)-like protein/PAS domain S-box-containing protein [Paenibacillus harenae]
MEHIHGSYDSLLVVFSYIIAVAASYTALDLAGRVSNAKGRSRLGWLSFGAAIMGMGIWSMHFVGMLAYSLPITIRYDIVIVFASVVAAIAAAFIALYVVGRNQLTVSQLLTGGLLLATGISTMHYVGMAAILVDLSYDPPMFALSVAIAIVASIAALWLSFYFRGGKASNAGWKKLGSGIIMGAAIVGMHYTGMFATHFHPNNRTPFSIGIILDQELLGYLIVGGTLFTLGLSLFGIVISKRLNIKDTALEESEKWYKSLYDNNLDGIVSVDLNHQVTGFNEAALHITGLTKERVLGKPISELVSVIAEADRVKTSEMFFHAFEGLRSTHDTTLIKDGEAVMLTVTIVPVIIEGSVAGSYIIFKDITDEKQAEQRIHHLAFHDELTGLPNRRKFNQAIGEWIEARSASRLPFAVMVLDIDRFKMINDSLGHTYGDIFLQELTNRIHSSLEGQDVMLARMGGDEFTILCRNCSEEAEIIELAERIIHSIQIPYRLMDNDFYVSASVGIALFPQHGQNAAELLKNADTAMYEVKKKGKNGYLFFSHELDALLQQKIELEGDLRKAVENGELLLHYQPQIRTSDNEMIGVEALVRWQHKEKGLLPPGTFIPIAEETGIIYEIGTWVLREACSQMRKWHLAGGPLIPVAVNLSSQQFHQPDLAGYVKNILDEVGLEPHFLELEITESMMMDATLSADIMKRLNEYGVRISLDDFGTGYSSLSYLKMFPIQKLKIDRSFIRDITNSGNDQAIVATIIAMAQNMNMEVIAEGIETKAQLDILTDKDCRKIQGYYFSKPLSAADVEQSFFKPQRSNAELSLSDS